MAKHRIIPAVFVVVYDGNLSANPEVLLQRRANTGFRDGEWDTPSGHVEPGEEEDVAAVRETREETGLVSDRADMDLFHIRTNEVDTPDSPYRYLFFRMPLSLCGGDFAIQPADGKTDAMQMFRLDALPGTTSPHVRAALAHIACARVTFSKAE